MVTLHLTRRNNTDSELQVTLPPGEVEVIITVPADSLDAGGWPDLEIQQMTQVSPKTGAEIAALLNEMEPGFQNIGDSAAWVEVK